MKPDGRPPAVAAAHAAGNRRHFMTQAQELERQYRKGLITGEEYDAALLALATPEEKAEAEARIDAATEAKLTLRG